MKTSQRKDNKKHTSCKNKFWENKKFSYVLLCFPKQELLYNKTELNTTTGIKLVQKGEQNK
jgi:hypothetical protein